MNEFGSSSGEIKSTGINKESVETKSPSISEKENKSANEISEKLGLSDGKSSDPTLRNELIQEKGEYDLFQQKNDKAIDQILKSADNGEIPESEAKEKIKDLEEQQEIYNSEREIEFKPNGTSETELNDEVRELLENQGRGEDEIREISKSGFEHQPVPLEKGDRLYSFVPEGEIKGQSNCYWMDESTYMFVSERYPPGTEAELQNAFSLPSQPNWDDVNVVTIEESHQGVESTVAPAEEKMENQSYSTFGGLQQITPHPEKISKPDRLVDI